MVDTVFCTAKKSNAKPNTTNPITIMTRYWVFRNDFFNLL